MNNLVWEIPEPRWQPSPSFEELEFYSSGKVRARPGSYAPKWSVRNNMHGQMVVSGTGRRGQMTTIPLAEEMLRIWSKPKPWDGEYHARNLQIGHYDDDKSNCDIWNIYWTTEENLYKLSSLEIRKSVLGPARIVGFVPSGGGFFAGEYSSILEASQLFGMDPVDFLTIGSSGTDYKGFSFIVDI